MKNILVIGNGFDIAHGLYTKYIDFYNFCNAIKRVINDKKEIAIRDDIKEELLKSKFMKSTANIISNKKIVSDDILGKMINICKDNYWLNRIEERNISNDPHWCDIEGVIADEISNLAYVAKKYNGARVDVCALNESKEIVNLYQEIKINVRENQSFKTSVYLFKEKLLSDLNDLTWMLEIYLSKFLNRKSKTYKFFETLNTYYLINFNYTNTYNKLYKKKHSNSFYSWENKK